MPPSPPSTYYHACGRRPRSAVLDTSSIRSLPENDNCNAAESASAQISLGGARSMASPHASQDSVPCRKETRRATHNLDDLGKSSARKAVDAKSSLSGSSCSVSPPATSTPESTLAASCGSSESAMDNIDDILASSFGSSCQSVSGMHSIREPSSDLASEEAYGQSLWRELQRQQRKLDQRKLKMERSKQKHALFLERLKTRKAALAVEQGGGPMNWGISIQQLQDFTESIKFQLRSYCVTHRYEPGSWTHVCLDSRCQHNHGCAPHRGLAPSEDATQLANVEPNMHTVVQVFIKPATKDNNGICGLAMKWNAQHPKRVEKFVSHSWNGRFENFVRSLSQNLLQDTIVFICSFALPQNLDVGPILKTDLEATPFALAHNVAHELCLVVDRTIDVIDRIWVIYELYLSLIRKKPLQICLTEADSKFQSKVLDKIKSLDVRLASATKDLDLQAIRGAIAGSEEHLNEQIRRKLEERVHQYQQFMSTSGVV